MLAQCNFSETGTLVGKTLFIPIETIHILLHDETTILNHSGRTSMEVFSPQKDINSKVLITIVMLHCEEAIAILQTSWVLFQKVKKKE